MSNVLKKAAAFSKEFKKVEGSDTVFQLLQYAAMYLASVRTGEAAEKWDNIANTISTVRTVGRWTGMLDTGLWIASEWSDPQEDPINHGLELSRAISIWVYYPLEHLWFLDSIKLLKLKDPGWYSRSSCQAWCLYIVLTLLQILYNSYRSRKLPSESSLIDFSKNSFDLPLSIHWSLAEGCLSDKTTALLGIAGSLIQVFQRWTKL